MPEQEHVPGVVLVQPPRLPRSLSRHLLDRAEHVAGLEVDEGLGRLRGVRGERHRGVVAMFVHVIEHPADVVGHEIDLQRPGGVRVSERERQVRHPAEHHALVADGLGQLDLSAVDTELDPTGGEQVEAGRGDDDVGLDLLPGPQLHPALGEGLDLVGHDRGLTMAETPEQVAVRDQTDPLVPGVVARLEVGVDVDAPIGRELGPVAPADPLPDQFGLPAAEPEEGLGEQDVLPADDRIDESGGQDLPEQISEGVPSRQRQHVAGRALEHRHVRGVGAIAGTRVTAVAPLPITTTRLSV